MVVVATGTLWVAYPRESTVHETQSERGWTPALAYLIIAGRRTQGKSSRSQTHVMG